MLSLMEAANRLRSCPDSELFRLYACASDTDVTSGSANTGGGKKIEFYRARMLAALERFGGLFGAGREVAIFSAPGRTEVGGNHTDHQRGRVLAASVNLDVIAVVALRTDSIIHIQSEGYLPDELDAGDTAPRKAEENKSISLIRGVCAKFAEAGCPLRGFDAYTTSAVLSGSGLSSSAAFEILLGTILNELFFDGRKTPLELAQIGQYAENNYFGKPSGLLDQAASSVGGLVMLDFADPASPKAHRVDFDFSASEHALCIIDTKSSHAGLTPDYAAIPAEMKQVAAQFGKEVLQEVPEEEFFAALPKLRQGGECGDRALLRAIHFYEEDARVLRETEALEQGDFARFKELVIESGRSSFCYLQNIYSPSHPAAQGVSLTLALCERLLTPEGGAWRVHGGGFAGTVQAFVPNVALAGFVAEIERVLGKGSCYVLQIRPVGGARVL